MNNMPHQKNSMNFKNLNHTEYSLTITELNYKPVTKKTKQNKTRIYQILVNKIT